MVQEYEYGGYQSMSTVYGARPRSRRSVRTRSCGQCPAVEGSLLVPSQGSPQSNGTECQSKASRQHAAITHAPRSQSAHAPSLAR
eukprot:2318650-Prymnesium_polylepis.1